MMKKGQRDLENLNLTVIRFTNEQIKNEDESAIEIVSSTIEKFTVNKKRST